MNTINKKQTEHTSTYKIQTFYKERSNISVQKRTDFLSNEAPLQIMLKKNSLDVKSYHFVVTMRTPGSDKEFVTGLLFNEGIIQSSEDIVQIDIKNKIVEVLLAEANPINLKTLERNVLSTSSCGVCSKTNLKDVNTDTIYLPYMSRLTLDSNLLFGIQNKITDQEGLFDLTGSMHSAVLLDKNLNVLKKYEDVGRHNALDKLIGYSVQENLMPLSQHVLVLSGRISFELVQKASKAGISIVIAKGAPTSLAIDEAYAQSICLIGFMKNNSYNVYCGFDRIKT